ncbi:MAG: 5'-methylthioadenosine/adenosylhomocysteine nucleosidase [Nitrospirae bacterium]|nr:5'-methylthioadenosine/adenosylhomocysteine nucleosidase [Nitrospirota bacterium]
MACLRIVVFVLLLNGLAHADVGIICTLKDEMEQILKDMKVEDKVYRAERVFYKGLLDGVKIVLVRSPMGKVNNTITAQLLVSHFNVDMITSIGFAGAVNETLKIGDVFISINAIQHDFGTIKPYGFIWGRSPEIGEPKEITPEKWATSKSYSYGIIVSGDQFIASEEKREWLKKKFNALAVDMGAAAIFEVCKQNSIRCLFIRTISDSADIEGRINFNSAVQNENYRGVNVLKEFLQDYYKHEVRGQ